MQEYAGKIKAYLDQFRQEKYSGGIKMAFEEGRPQTFWRSDVPDFKSNPTDEKFSLEKTLEMATDSKFSGSLFFVLENGEIKHYYCIETLQGRKLMERLDSLTPQRGGSTGGKRTVIALRKKEAATT
jgi:hypothetical protein